MGGAAAPWGGSPHIGGRIATPEGGSPHHPWAGALITVGEAATP